MSTLPNVSLPPTAPLRQSNSVLVVDDDPFMLELLRDMLNDLGVRDVRVARGGDEAARSLQNPGSHPDAVICDLNMPGKDGFLLMEELATRQFKGRVVVVSGMDARTLNSAALMGRFHRLQVAATLSKPVQSTALAAALGRA